MQIRQIRLKHHLYQYILMPLHSSPNSSFPFLDKLQHFSIQERFLIGVWFYLSFKKARAHTQQEKGESSAFLRKCALS